MILFKALTTLILIVCSLILTSCTFQKAPIGSEDNPIKIHFVPSVDAKVIESNSSKLKDYLEKNTPYKYQITVPQSYIAVIESFGTKKADVSALNTYGYMMAHEKYNVEARLIIIRHGLSTYKSQFLAKSDSPIKGLKDLQGKKVAFVDPSSMSGYLLPLKTLNDRGVKPGQTVFAMRHDSVVTMIYQGQVDAGATFYSPPSESGIEDARKHVLTQFPDVEKKIKIIELSEEIPNDPLVFRKDLPEEIKKTIVEAFVNYIRTPEGKEAFNLVLGATDFQPATDANFDKVKEILKTTGKTVQELMKK